MQKKKIVKGSKCLLSQTLRDFFEFQFSRDTYFSVRNEIREVAKFFRTNANNC